MFTDRQNSSLFYLNSEKTILWTNFLNNIQRENQLLLKIQQPEDRLNKITANERILQLAIIKDKTNELLTEFTEDRLKCFVGLLLGFHSMTLGDENITQSWGYHHSRLKVHIETILSQLQNFLGQHEFSILKSQAIEYPTQNKDRDFNNEYKLHILNVTHNKINNFNDIWNNILLTFATLGLSIASSNEKSNMPFIDIDSPLIFKTSHTAPSPPHKKLLTTSQSLCQELEILIETKISYNKKYKKILKLKSQVEHLCQEIKFTLTKNLIMNAEDQKLFNVLYQLDCLLIDNCFLVLQESCKSIFPKSAIKKSLLQLAMHCHSKILFNHYARFLKIPTGVWLKLYKLFSFARNNKLEKKKLSTVGDWHNQLKTIQDQFIFCLLLSMIQPSQFNKSNLDIIIYALEGWINTICLSEVSRPLLDHFYVNITDDLPPTINEPNNIINDSNYLQINITNLINHLKKLLITNNQTTQVASRNGLSDAELDLPIYVIQQIINALTTKPLDLPTFNLNNPILYIAFGLHNCFDLLKRKLHCDKMAFNSYGNCNLIIEDPSIEDSSNAEISTSIMHTYACEALTFNGKFCQIKIQSPLPHNLQPGEVICFQNIFSQIQSYLTGIVLSIRINVDQSALLDIAIYSLTSFPLISIEFKSKLFKDFPVLLLLNQTEPAKTWSLVVPRLIFKPDQTITVQYNDVTFDLILLNLINSTSEYQIYHVDFQNIPDLITNTMLD